MICISISHTNLCLCSFYPDEGEKRIQSFHMNLCVQAALDGNSSAVTTVQALLRSYVDGSAFIHFLMELYSHVKTCEAQKGRKLLPTLQPVFHSAPAVWSVDLSERKASIFLEVLKLQTQKRPVELRGWSHEESEVRSFLRCLPYISQLR